MLANIRGLVDRLDLAPAKGMMPLFEAISNAMDAIEDGGQGFLSGQVTIRLLTREDLARKGGDDTLVVDGFQISDNGIGFTDANLASFGEAYTLSKIKVGGKGVGRFTFLKVFDKVSVESVYEAGGDYCLRKFDFSITEELSGANHTERVDRPTGSTLTVSGIVDLHPKLTHLAA